MKTRRKSVDNGNRDGTDAASEDTGGYQKLEEARKNSFLEP